MKKILIVEDEFSYVKLLTDELKMEGYDVISAKNGKEGLEMATKSFPDLILLDIRMPVMDGLTMLRKLRKNPYGSKVKVILLTNLEPDGDIVKKVLTDQPTYYLIKSDTNLFELKAKVKELVGGVVETVNNQTSQLPTKTSMPVRKPSAVSQQQAA